MNPQGSELVNKEYFDNLIHQINSVKTCADLERMLFKALSENSATLDAINAQIAKLAPILALLTAPATNPAAIVTWITNFISAVLGPIALPHTTYLAQLTELSVQIGRVVAAATEKAATIPNCTLPPIP